MHCCIADTKNNNFFTKLFAIVMLLYLTFTMAKFKIKLLFYFFPNSHGCGQRHLQKTILNIIVVWIDLDTRFEQAENLMWQFPRHGKNDQKLETAK